MTTLTDVHATDLLLQRSIRARDWARLDTLVPVQLDPTSLREGLEARCEQAKVVCRAEAAGISMFGTQSFDQLVWLVTTPELINFKGDLFPRGDSPCGVCFEFRAPQLYKNPHLFFGWMARKGLAMEELLVAPIQGPYGAFFGTLWVIGNPTEADELVDGHFNLVHSQMLEKLTTGMWSKLNTHERAG